MKTLTPDEIHLVRSFASPWLKLLKEKETNVLARLYGEFKNGNKDLITIIAEYATIREQIKEITNALNAQD